MSANVTQFLEYVRKIVEKIPALEAKAKMIEAKAKDLALLEYRKAHTPCLL